MFQIIFGHQGKPVGPSVHICATEKPIIIIIIIIVCPLKKRSLQIKSTFAHAINY